MTRSYLLGNVLFLLLIGVGMTLTSCSDEESDDLSSVIFIETDEIPKTTNVNHLYASWALLGKSNTENGGIYPQGKYIINIANDGTFQGEAENNKFHGNYVCQDDGTFLVIEYEGVSRKARKDETFIHETIKKCKKFLVSEKGAYMALYYSDTGYLLFRNDKK